MDYLVKNYLSTCIVEFSQYGFKKKNKAFVRTINDVMQNFAIEKIGYGRECRVVFAIIPFCLRIEKKHISGGVYSRELSGFEPLEFGNNTIWNFDPKSEERMDYCISQIIIQIKKHLIPYFTKADSCKNALGEVIRRDKLFNENIKAGFRLAGGVDKAQPRAEIDLLDSTKYFMALKNEDYDFAIKCREALLNQNIDAYNERRYYSHLTTAILEKDLEKIEKLKDEVYRLKTRDIDFFQLMIKENEEYSKETLKAFL